MVGKAPTKSQIKVLIRSIYLQNREALRSNRECWTFIVLAFVVTDDRTRYTSKFFFFFFLAHLEPSSLVPLIEKDLHLTRVRQKHKFWEFQHPSLTGTSVLQITPLIRNSGASD